MKKILAFGDSNTWGLVPGSSPKERYPSSVRWTGLLGQVRSDIDIYEEGLCGRTTFFDDPYRPGLNGLSYLRSFLSFHGPFDGAVIMLGTNDCKPLYGASSSLIGQGLSLCLSELEKYIPSSSILVVSPIFLGSDVWREEKDPDFSRASVSLSQSLKYEYSSVASSHGASFVAASDYVAADPSDDEHLSPEGHRKLARVLAAHL